MNQSQLAFSFHMKHPQPNPTQQCLRAGAGPNETESNRINSVRFPIAVSMQKRKFAWQCGSPSSPTMSHLTHHRSPTEPFLTTTIGNYRSKSTFHSLHGNNLTRFWERNRAQASSAGSGVSMLEGIKMLNPSAAVDMSIPGICGCQWISFKSFWPCKGGR